MAPEVLTRPSKDPRRSPLSLPQTLAVGLLAALAAYFLEDTSLVSVTAQETPPVEFAREPPDRIVRAETCGECHLSEFEVWKKTPHATGFKSLHRTERAEAIAKKMGYRLMKRDSPCLSCHYTPVVEGGQLRAISGVSCESCHGAARDWLDVHNDYGKGLDHTSEPVDHRNQRIARSREAGMRRPSDLYATVSSCFGCHTVPDEDLVNVGGHSTGSAGFELVEWSQGVIRHNFLESFLNGDGTQNAERSLPEQRPLYVVGRALDLEHSLRGAAEAKEDGVYSKAMARRVKVTLLEVRKILAKAPHPALEEIPAIVAETKVVPGNRQALLAAADRVGAATRRFLSGYEPQQLAGLDPLILGTAGADSLADTLAQTEGADDGPIPPDGFLQSEGSEGAQLAGGSPADGPGAGPGAPAGVTGGDPGVPAAGKFKRRIRTASQHQTLGPGACSGCHEQANEWWISDPHYDSAGPFFDRQQKNVQIARLYGLNAAKMTLGNQVCMDCHGTIISGNEAFDVFDGVSCESCHGSAKDFLEPHKEGDKALGLSRPGYVKALTLGMEELKKGPIRAKRCSDCHYITEPRLISAGHPSGKGFDYVGGMGKIRHWERDTLADGPLRQAFDAVLGRRGGVPKVELARLPSAAAARLAQESQTRSPRLARATGGTWNRPRPTAAAARATAGSGGPAPPPPRVLGNLELPPFPEVDAATTIEDLLLILQRRLDLLHAAVASEGNRAP